MEIRFLGHAAFELSDGSTSVLIDPYLTENPKAAVSADELSPQAILLTHGHFDHFGDTPAIAERAGSDVVAIVEIARELAARGAGEGARPEPRRHRLAGLGLGEARPRLAHLHHASKGTVNTAAGLIVNIGGKTVYHLGDTALFSDLELIASSVPGGD